MQNEEQIKKPPVQNSKQFQSSVKVIGEYAPLKKSSNENHIRTLKFDPNSKSFIPNNISNSLMKSCNMYTKVKINPIKTFAQGQTIGIIDQNSNAWIFSDIFEFPVNISYLLKKRVTQMFLNQKQAIVKTKKGLILINWGAKKFFDNDQLMKIPIYDSKSFYQNFFEAFSILDGSSNDIFLISNIKKSQNLNKIYRVTNEGTQICGYPTLQKFKGFDCKILGLSVGKYHALCWDEIGGIYSWGSRTLALGFEDLPDQDLITQPTRLNFNFLVKTAFAANQYSLALSSQGKLYEWGIKKQVNQINEELIFQPRVLPFKYFNCSNQKFTTLKGKNEKFGVISTTGEMYVWGQKTRIFIHPHASIPKQWQNGRLYEPYLVHIPPDEKIIDFVIEQNYLCLVLIPKSCKYQMQQETQYWTNVVNSVRNKFHLKKYQRLETEENRRHERKKTTRIQTQIQNTIIDPKENLRKQLMIKRQLSNRQLPKSQNSFRMLLKSSRNDRVSKAEMVKKSKQKYFQMVKSQQNLFNYIMKPLKNQKSFQICEGQIPKRDYKRSHATIALTLNLMKNHTQKNSLQETNKAFNNFQQTIKSPPSLPDYLKDYDFQRVQQIKRKRREQNKKLLYRTTSEAFAKKTDKKSYAAKLQQVLEKKKQLQILNFNQTVKKLEENSLQHRMKRHQQLQMQKEREQNKELLKNTLYKYLIKNYIVKMFGSPLGQGRDIKIQNFARNLKFQRIEKNIRKVFIKAKVRFGLKKLQTFQLSRFVLLTMMWKRYVKHFRERKYCQQRRIIAEQITKFFVKDKIKLGLSTSNMNVRKIQKFREWLALVKNERMKCLKFLWKIQLMNIMKVNPENQNMVICHLPKYTEQISFQSLYIEKVQQNPNLKLSIFLNKSPLFKIKVQYFRTVANLFTEQRKPLHRSQKIINYLAPKKRTKIKFFDNEVDQDKEPSHKLNIMSGDIFPYSLHYNYFSRPKNYDITLSELMKKSDKWVREQKMILEKILNDIIYKHEKVYLNKSLEYDLQLAKYIRDKYDVFSEKRWKYIIEYNQIQKTFSKKKKQKQLQRIMDLIGMKKLLDQDCIPQKHIILQEALKRKDSPKPPNQFIVFGQKQFKEVFRIYYENIHLKAKQMRKMP